MNEREKLIKELSAEQFAFWETSIFLDTHKNDKEALESREKYKAKAENLRKEYVKKFGPLDVQDVYGDTTYSWINSPWPWE